MLTLDGSYGEGGGQLLRTALSLSCVNSTPVRIDNIRAGRSKPGLAPQHLAGVRLLTELCGAAVRGAEIGSMTLEFKPGPIGTGDFHIEIGTAGSVTLLAQCVLPAAVHSQGNVKIELAGGTDVRWSPPSDYLLEVFAPAARRFGADFEYTVLRRGYYPRGGGAALLKCSPSRLRAARITEPLKNDVMGACHLSNLPEHVCRRMVEAAQKEVGRKFEFRYDCRQGGPATGCGLFLWSGYIGAGAIGERGLPADEVGKRAARAFKKNAGAPGAVDPQLADQLIPLMALSDGPSEITTAEITEHARTNAWVCERVLGVRFELEDGSPSRISTRGLR